MTLLLGKSGKLLFQALQNKNFLREVGACPQTLITARTFSTRLTFFLYLFLKNACYAPGVA